MFAIETVKSYPKDYTETTNVAQDELRKNTRPELTEKVEDMDSYYVIYIGYRNSLRDHGIEVNKNFIK